MPDRQGSGSTLSYIAILALVLGAAFSSPTWGQTGDTERPLHVARRKQGPPSLQAQYFYLLRLQLHLDREADKRQQRGLQKEAEELRSHVQGQLHFSDAQAGILRQVALEYDEQYRAINAEVSPIAKADRDWVRANGKAAGLPPNRARVHELGLQRKAALEDAMSKLNSRLGPEGAAQVQTYLATIFAPHDPNARTHKFSPPAHPKFHAPPEGNNSTGNSAQGRDLSAEGEQ